MGGCPDTRHRRPGNVDSTLVAPTSESEVMSATAGAFSQADSSRNSSLSGARSQEKHGITGESNRREQNEVLPTDGPGNGSRT